MAVRSVLYIDASQFLVLRRKMKVESRWNRGKRGGRKGKYIVLFCLLQVTYDLGCQFFLLRNYEKANSSFRKCKEYVDKVNTKLSITFLSLYYIPHPLPSNTI